ncbi:hypothetical protein DASC09_014230 [Saccharomycopsis crataegensis]|uniref:Myb-like domain-containing protein n=1 Tax=Saccharomycopsis crataegensis TaxID=43959 RepID=A0AAV5QGX5_9ASCO|nr:hypothetical protein DASC09_014230 [Saccharomycopsis crataegensis]
MNSKIVLPPLSSVVSEPLHHCQDNSIIKVKLPGVAHLMNDGCSNNNNTTRFHHQSRSVSMGYIPTLSSSLSSTFNNNFTTSKNEQPPSSGLYSPITSANTSPMTASHPHNGSRIRARSQPVCFTTPMPYVVTEASASFSFPAQPQTPPYLPPSPVYQYPSPTLQSQYPQFPVPQQQQQQLQQQQSYTACQPPVYYQLQSSGPTSTNNKVVVEKQASAWSPQDDKLLRFLKEERKLGWRDVATHFPRRTPNACQFRWRRIVNASGSNSGILKKNQGKFQSKKSSVNYLLNGK